MTWEEDIDCGSCVTASHCEHHRRCLAECVPSDLVEHVCPETIQIGDVVVYDPVHDETPIVVETEDDVNFYRSEGSELVAIYRHPEWRR